MRIRMHMTLGKRIASGITLVLVLMVMVGMAGISGLMRVLGVMDFYSEINQFKATLSSLKQGTDQYHDRVFHGRPKGQGRG